MKRFSTLSALLIAASLALAPSLHAQKGWSADNGDGTFTNPLLWGDWPDPDVIRVGADVRLTFGVHQNKSVGVRRLSVKHHFFADRGVYWTSALDKLNILVWQLFFYKCAEIAVGDK